MNKQDLPTIKDQVKRTALIKNVLEDMVGNQYKYGGHTHTITSFNINEEKEKVTIQTNRRCYERPYESVETFLNSFEPVQKSDWGMMQTGEPHLPEMQINSAVISKLKDVLMDNIEKVKTDKLYIPQATSIKLMVDSVIDLAKIEVAYMEAYVRVKKNA